jgi:hypothetical protein
MIRGPPGLVADALVLLADDSRRSEELTDGVREGGDDARRPGRIPVGVLRPLVGGDDGDFGVCDGGGDDVVEGGDGDDAEVTSTASLIGSSVDGVSASVVGMCSSCCCVGAAAEGEGGITITELMGPALKLSSVSGGGSTNVGRDCNPASGFWGCCVGGVATGATGTGAGACGCC